MYLCLFLVGVCAMLIMWHIQRSSHQVFKYHWSNFIERFRMNDKGETDPGAGSGAGSSKGGESKGEVKLDPVQQEFVNKLIDQKYARWKQEEATKYRDYEELAKFKQEHLKAQDVQAQAELEKAKKYDEVKKAYETKINEYGQIVSKKDQEIVDLKISHNLINEIVRQNGYTEETLALIKSNAMLDANGNVLIKSKDANGMDVSMTVADGIKKVLEARPYLVKSTHKQGGGTGAGEGMAGAKTAQGADDLMTLNSLMQEAMRSGDWKTTNEIKQKIKSKMHGRTAYA